MVVPGVDQKYPLAAAGRAVVRAAGWVDCSVDCSVELLVVQSVEKKVIHLVEILVSE